MKRRPAVLALALSGLVQLALAFGTYGGGADMDNFAATGRAVAEHGFDAYGDGGANFPYFPGFHPWLYVSHVLAEATPLPFHGVLQLPLIAAVLGLAWMVHGALLEAGRPRREAELGLGAVAFGPLFLQVAGWHGQLDPLAFLPALAGVLVWRRGGAGRWWKAGLLLGAGAAVKTVPLLLLLALVPTARGAGEWLRTAVTAAAVPLALLIPYVVADPEGVRTIFEYAGIPGAGGLSLLVQPELAKPWVWHLPLEAVPLHAPSARLQDLATPILGLALLAATALAWRRRLPAAEAGILVLLVTYAVSANLFAYYLLWVVPFLLVTGRLRIALAVQVVAVGLQGLIHLGPHLHALVWVYVAVMAAVTVAAAAGAGAVLRRQEALA